MISSTVLRTAPMAKMRSKLLSGFSTTPNALVGIGSRRISGRVTGSEATAGLDDSAALDMDRPLLFHGLGEEHGVDLSLEARGRLRLAVPPGRVELRLHLARVRRQQQDAVADLDRLGDRVRDEKHGELGLVPELK